LNVSPSPLTLELACELIWRPSVTPLDEGCQEQMPTRCLAACGFFIEFMRIEEVDNLASHGEREGPRPGFAGHTDVGNAPTGLVKNWQHQPDALIDEEGMFCGRGAA
jgi:succinyl-diaminopimelate desuccinylase